MDVKPNLIKRDIKSLITNEEQVWTKDTVEGRPALDQLPSPAIPAQWFLLKP